MEKILVVSPAFTSDPNFVIAACRAGELGIFDLGYPGILNAIPFDWGGRKKERLSVNDKIHAIPAARDSNMAHG